MTGKQNGVIHSPNYPEKYATSDSGGSIQCHWFIYAQPNHKILMYFEEFEVEGKPNGKPSFWRFLCLHFVLPGSAVINFFESRESRKFRQKQNVKKVEKSKNSNRKPNSKSFEITRNQTPKPEMPWTWTMPNQGRRAVPYVIALLAAACTIVALYFIIDTSMKVDELKNAMDKNSNGTDANARRRIIWTTSSRDFSHLILPLFVAVLSTFFLSCILLLCFGPMLSICCEPTIFLVIFIIFGPILLLAFICFLVLGPGTYYGTVIVALVICGLLLLCSTPIICCFCAANVGRRKNLYEGQVIYTIENQEKAAEINTSLIDGGQGNYPLQQKSEQEATQTQQSPKKEDAEVDRGVERDADNAV